MLNHPGKEIQKSLFCSSGRSNFSFPTKKPYIQIYRIYFFINLSVNHLLLSPLTRDQETRTIKCRLAPTNEADQNNFKANQKSCSITLLSSSHTSFCFSYFKNCTPLGLPVPASSLQSSTGNLSPIQLLLQLDGSRHLQQPLSDLGWDHDRRGCRTCWKWELNTLLTGILPDEARTPSLYVWMHQTFPASSFTT